MTEEKSQDGTPNPETNPLKRSAAKRALKEFLVFFRRRLSLDDDKADPQETIEYVRKGVEFAGTNVWILIFAILVASIGLNMNSAAVIIGAMLISPLMGPIMGVGMGVGINDFSLIKKSAKNLGLMVSISVITSTLYFWLTPLSDAQSELLARTTPTIWDVLIALFGGLAGIVAGSRKEKSNAIPGVAIATALMPPLCTAGYGLATGNMAYFLGAFYLFTINSVFISVSTLLVVRFLKYPTKEFVDQEKEKRVKRYITVFVFLFILPSLYIAFNLVKKSVFEREASVFISENFIFPESQVISRNIVIKDNERKIEVAIIGEPISAESIAMLEEKLKANDRLKNTKLIIRQGSVQDDMEMMQIMNERLKSGIIEELYKRNELALESKDQQIDLLQNEIIRLRSKELPLQDLSGEIHVQHPNIEEFTITRNPMVRLDSMRTDTLTFAYVKFKTKPKDEEIERLTKWLKVRTKSDEIKLIIE